VQALSSTLLRVEPKGPKGWEDRKTFMVVNRSYPGVSITVKKQKDGHLVQSDYYTLLLRDATLANGKLNFMIFDTAGKTVYDSGADGNTAQNLLHWPAPYTSKAYALVDSPRFSVPDWCVAPAPEGTPGTTNGYDFQNGVYGDTYVFLLGEGLEGYRAARVEFQNLAGPVPLLPDFAYGTWFTWWHPYTEVEAKADVNRWDAERIPLDVFGLDVDWRVWKPHVQEHTYQPNADLFPDLPEWFGWLKSKGLKTYFNDHPFPVAQRGGGGTQTSKEEVLYRWNSLTNFMKQGLTFWWFDINWVFSIPPPNINAAPAHPGVSQWQGLTHAAWGSHVYWTTVANFDWNQRDKNDRSWGGRPITLTKFGEPDWKKGADPVGYRESPAQHRYPVWWTGDYVSLQAALESAVDSGLHGFKPYVHSDCGSDTFGDPGDLVRWTQFCAMSTILRFHGSDHRPWIYGEKHHVLWVLPALNNYIRLRYKFVPSLIAGGQKATSEGHPIAARGDLYWPELPASRDNHQYIWLDDLLIAPIYKTDQNVTARTVWIPPGEWEDAWDGSLVSGPKEVTVWRAFTQIPLWYRHDGGLIITTDSDALRVADQDWSTLNLDAFPSTHSHTTRKSVFERFTAARTDITMTTDGGVGDCVQCVKVLLSVGQCVGCTAEETHQFLLRVHLRPRQRILTATLGGQDVAVTHIDAATGVPGWAYFPFGGAGQAPAWGAGPVAEMKLPSGASDVEILIAEVEITASDASLMEAKFTSSAVVEEAFTPEGRSPGAAPLLCGVALLAATLGAIAWRRSVPPSAMVVATAEQGHPLILDDAAEKAAEA